MTGPDQTHPSDEQLARWVTDGDGRGTAYHAVSCSFCEQRLEAITELAPRIRDQLAASLEPPETFAQRLAERLNERLFDQETFAVLADLVDVVPETTRLLLDPEGPTAGGEPTIEERNHHDG